MSLQCLQYFGTAHSGWQGRAIVRKMTRAKPSQAKPELCSQRYHL